MKKCLLIGNCQQYPLKVLMQSVKDFNNQYEVIDDLGPIHTWTIKQVTEFESRYDDADIVLTQPIMSEKYGLAQTYRLIAFNHRKKKIPIIVYPNIDFAGFFPFAIRMPVDFERDNVPDAHCAIVLLCYLSRLSPVKAVEFCNQFYSDESRLDLYRKIFELALQRMERFDKTFLSVGNVSQLFRDKYKECKLTLNRLHPSNTVCSIIANSVLSQLGNFEAVKAPHREFWAHDEMPISVSVRKALGMEIEEADEYYYVKGILKRLDEYIIHLYFYYQQNPRVVEEGIEINKNKLATIYGIVNNDYSQVNIDPLFTW